MSTPKKSRCASKEAGVQTPEVTFPNGPVSPSLNTSSQYKNDLPVDRNTPPSDNESRLIDTGSRNETTDVHRNSVEKLDSIVQIGSSDLASLEQHEPPIEYSGYCSSSSSESITETTMIPTPKHRLEETRNDNFSPNKKESDCSSVCFQRSPIHFNPIRRSNSHRVKNSTRLLKSTKHGSSPYMKIDSLEGTSYLKKLPRDDLHLTLYNFHHPRSATRASPSNNFLSPKRNELGIQSPPQESSPRKRLVHRWETLKSLYETRGDSRGDTTFRIPKFPDSDEGRNGVTLFKQGSVGDDFWGTFVVNESSDGSFSSVSTSQQQRRR